MQRTIWNFTAFARLFGPIILLGVYLLIPETVLPQMARITLGVTLWVAWWWVTESIPLAMTSLLPFILFPLFQVMKINEVASSYANPIIFLYAGGFMLALAMEKWNLHRRIALNILAVTGTRMHLMVLGFMLATGFISMWISNTATAAMMLPIGLAIVGEFHHLLSHDIEGKERPIDLSFAKALMLSIAYAANIGGMATPVGSPTNLVFTGFIRTSYNVEISFLQYMMYGVPIVAILIYLCWLLLTRINFKLDRHEVPGSREILAAQLHALGPVKAEEKWVLGVFGSTALIWIIRPYLLAGILPALDDNLIALIAASLLFLIPSSKRGETIMDWEMTKKLPWGVLWLFGGGFALAKGFEVSGLADILGTQLASLQNLPYIVLLIVLVIGVVLFTEIASNVATITLAMPILAQLAVATDIHPFGMMIAATMAASCGFMMPAGTPPNAIVFGSGYLNIRDMTRAGFLLDLISMIVVVLLSYWLVPLIWGVDVGSFPLEWRKN